MIEAMVGNNTWARGAENESISGIGEASASNEFAYPGGLPGPMQRAFASETPLRLSAQPD